MPPAEVQAIMQAGDLAAPDVIYIPETDDWLATIVLPLKAQLAGSDAILSARIDLRRLQEIIAGNPFAKTGVLTVVDRNGHQVLDPKRQDLGSHAIVAEALGLLSSSSRSLGVEPYARPDGEVMLGAYAFPRPFRWAVWSSGRSRTPISRWPR